MTFVREDFTFAFFTSGADLRINLLFLVSPSTGGTSSCPLNFVEGLDYPFPFGFDGANLVTGLDDSVFFPFPL